MTGNTATPTTQTAPVKAEEKQDNKPVTENTTAPVTPTTPTQTEQTTDHKPVTETTQIPVTTSTAPTQTEQATDHKPVAETTQIPVTTPTAPTQPVAQVQPTQTDANPYPVTASNQPSPSYYNQGNTATTPNYSSNTPASQINQTSNSTVIRPFQTMVFSYGNAITIYRDGTVTVPAGMTLAANITEWNIDQVSLDASGNPLAYRLSEGRWVKASDVNLQRSMQGVIVLNQDTQSYDVNGNPMAIITSNLTHRVDAERYINGKHSLKLANSNQWVNAADGVYHSDN